MAARIFRPSILAMRRGLGVSAGAGRTFWPSAIEAVARQNAAKINRATILQVSQNAAKAALAMPRTTPSGGTGPFFCWAGKELTNLKAGGFEPASVRCLGDSYGCSASAQFANQSWIFNQIAK